MTRRLWLVVIGVALGVGLGLAQEQAPARPFPNHEEPPVGWFCSPTAAQADHVCHCQRMMHDAPICESDVQEDANCSVYCHRDHCACPVSCVDPAPPTYED